MHTKYITHSSDSSRQYDVDSKGGCRVSIDWLDVCTHGQADNRITRLWCWVLWWGQGGGGGSGRDIILCYQGKTVHWFIGVYRVPIVREITALKVTEI